MTWPPKHNHKDNTQQDVERLTSHMCEIARGRFKKEPSQPDTQTTIQPLHTTHIGLTARSECNCQLATFQPTVLFVTALSAPPTPEPGASTESRTPEAGEGACGWRGRSHPWAYHCTWLGSHGVGVPQRPH
ncbi:unnamed protein product [Schistocephalus solidus]|uniref:Uncharacterized protein n=1 Tax=Schistocephalus solidus TaxID=70667 RepID=A0A183SA94_SCHSO|nr:unnamed protein product [Schistocephalus solidus]